MELDGQPFTRSVVINAGARSDDSSLDGHRQFFDRSEYGFFAGRELDSVHARPHEADVSSENRVLRI
jgi:hypothetical protein